MKKEELKGAFDRFNNLNIAVIGDIMLDCYWEGKVDRISPEAPVPVVQLKSKTYRLGGAANVALNLKSLGVNAILFSSIGSDEAGEQVLSLMKQEQLPKVGIHVYPNRPTTLKTRIMAQSHQLIRVDDETDEVLLPDQTEALWQTFKKVINDSQIDAVIFEDYDKGLITPTLIENVVSLCQERHIMVTVDPKKRNFLAYKGVTLFKPNLKEIREGLKTDVNPQSAESLSNAHNQLKQVLNHSYTFITLSEHGVFLADEQKTYRFPAHVRKIADVSGAGDTVIAVATSAFAVGFELTDAVRLANLAGGLVCEEAGVVPINKMRLLKEAELLF